MPKMCNCKRGFIREGRCCCMQCDAERIYDDYYTPEPPTQTHPNIEKVTQPTKTWRAPNLRKGDGNG